VAVDGRAPRVWAEFVLRTETGDVCDRFDATAAIKILADLIEENDGDGERAAKAFDRRLSEWIRTA